MSTAVAWGIAGFGWVAQDYMAPAIVAAGHRLVSICDPDREARRRAEAMGIRAYADVAALADDPDVEAVYVATPNHLHRPMVEALAERRKAVLCEKPMAATLAEAEAMARTCLAAGVLYGTAFDQRHHPAHRVLRDAIRAGRIGTVTAIRIVYACWLDHDWDRRGGRNWRIDASAAGGGATMDLAPHGIDLVDYLLDEPIVDLVALLQRRVHDYAVDDAGMLVGRTAAGVLASLHVAYNHPETLPRRRLEVLGTGGSITATDTMGQDPGGRLVFMDAVSGRETPIEVSDPGISPFVGQVRAFSEALRTGRHAAFSIPRDLHTMRLLDTAYRGGDPAAAPSDVSARRAFR